MVVRQNIPRLYRRGFTIVELAIVITVIGILAAITIVVYSGAQPRARDATRMHDLKEIQKAAELYKSEKGSYPLSSSGSGAWAGRCWSGNASTYIVGIESYLSPLPLDPKMKTSTSGPCYLYLSNGTDYMALAWGSMETICGGDPGNTCNPPDIQAMDRKSYPEASIAVYSPGAVNW